VRGTLLFVSIEQQVSIFFNALKSNVKWPRNGFVKVSSLVHHKILLHTLKTSCPPWATPLLMVRLVKIKLQKFISTKFNALTN